MHHSPDVQARLDSPGIRVPLSRISPKSVVARAAQHVAPCYATLVVVVGGERQSCAVWVAGFNVRRAALVRAVESIP